MIQQKSVICNLLDIVQSIEDDLMLALRTHEREDRGGFFSISRQVFCYVDYLGALASNGNNSTKNAVDYMEEYFTRANPDYEGKCNLLYNMWRNGTVHEYDPKVYVSSGAEKGFRLSWGANNTSATHNRKWHMKCFCRDSKPGYYCWFINLFELVGDLRKSVTFFAASLEEDAAFLAKTKRNLNKLSSDFVLDNKGDLLSKAMVVVDLAAGVINDRGEVICEFKDDVERNMFFKNWNNLTECT
jgi:hypothetical protein